MRKKRKYTYVPNRSIENVVTTNETFSGDELLDGVYIKGRRKFKKGGKIKKMSDRAIAEKIMELDAKAWEDLDIQSGSDLMQDKTKQRKYIDIMAGAEKLMARAKNPAAVMDILEDENYHSAYGILQKFARGGQTKSRTRNLNRRVQELVGESVWDGLSVDDQTELAAELVSEGVLAVPFVDGGQMPEKMAAGAEVAEGKFVVKYEINGVKKEKSFDDKDKAETFMDLMSSEDEVKNIELSEKSAKKTAKAQPASVNLFAKPTTATKKTTKTTDRVDVPVKGIGATIARYDALKEIIKNAKAEQEVLDGQLKEIGRDKFLEMYKDEGFRPKNFNLTDGSESIMYVVSDIYQGSRSGVSEEKAALLEPFDVLETQTKFLMNEKILNKPGVAEAISKMIMQSKILTDEDKAELIIAEAKTIVKKGTIDKLLQFDDPGMVFDLIEPTISLK